jgi:serine/threonine-protein kinase
MVGAAIVWLWYLALEPYVRRRWPQALISWNRLLSGRFRDPLVGRDILIGSLFALVAPGIYLLMHLAPKWLNEPPNAPEFWPSRFLLGPRFQVGGILSGPWLWFPLLILILLLAFRLLLKREWLAIPAVLALIVGFRFLFASPTDSLPLTISNAVFFALWWVVLIVVPLRFGLLASVAMWFMFPLIETPGMFGLTGWQAQSAWMALLFIAAVAGFGFYTALAGRPLFRDELLDR